jgi:pimeloyl-ACP methyl ester carboxylesterase
MSPINPDQYDVFGSPDAPPIVLVHGSTVTRAMWWPQIEALATDFHLITLDLPGHGASAYMPFTLGGAVALLGQVVSQTARRPVMVVGISLGGYVVLEFAAAYSEQVVGLVLASTTVNFTGLLGTYVRLVGWLLARVFDEGWQRERLMRSIRRKNPPAIAEPLIAAGLYPRAAGEAFRAVAGRDFRKPLATVDSPVLFLNGEDDAASRRGEQMFAAIARHGRLEHIARAGHLCNLQQMAAFNVAVQRFALDTFGAVRATTAVGVATTAC